MKIVGTIGWILCVVSFVIFLGLIKEACSSRLTGGADFSSARIVIGPQPHTAQTVEILGNTGISPLFTVKTDRACRVELHGRIKSELIEKRKKIASNGVEFMLKYAFPLRYEIYDQDQKLIRSSEEEIAYDSPSKVYSSVDRGVKTRSESIRHRFEKFRLQPPGQICIKVRTGPDSKFGSQMITMFVVVVDNVPSYEKRILIGAVLFLGGAAMGIYSFFIYPGRRRAAAQALEQKPTDNNV